MPNRYDAIARGKAIPDSVAPATERASRLRDRLERFECVRETKLVEDKRGDPEVIATVEDDDAPGTANREIWDDDSFRSDLLDLWANSSATYTRRDGDDVPPEGTKYRGFTLVTPLDEQVPATFPKDDLRPFQDKILFRTPDYVTDSGCMGVGTWGRLDSTEYHADEDSVLVKDPGDDISPVVEWDDVIAVARGHTANVILRGPAFEDVDEQRVAERHKAQYGR